MYARTQSNKIAADVLRAGCKARARNFRAAKIRAAKIRAAVAPLGGWLA